MQSLYSLPVLDSLLRQMRYHEALAVANEAPEILAPHLVGRIPSTLELPPEDSLVLAKIFLLQAQYQGGVLYALAARDFLGTLDSFYYDSIIFRMMEFLCAHRTHPTVDVPTLKKYILSLIKDTAVTDEHSDSFLGFLAEISEFSLLKEKIISLSEKNVDCRPVVGALLDYYYEDVYRMFLDTKLDNQYLLTYKINAYAYEDKIAELKELLEILPWQQLYTACFYIEDTHHLKIETSNENANLILSGEWKQEIMSNFMFKNSKTSFRFLESMSKARCPYISLCNCIMNAGTTNDTLYRNNKGMMNGREWVRFLEYAAIGMIHQGNINAFEILKEMLPSYETNNGEPAALMALGMMNARTVDKEVTDFLLNWLDSTNEEILFGACMGLGLCLLESSNAAVYVRLQALLSVDSTIAQESALYAIGLIFAGSGDEAVGEYIYSVQTKTDFPRVKRVCGLALALVNIYSSKDLPEDTARAACSEAAEDSGYETDSGSNAAEASRVSRKGTNQLCAASGDKVDPARASFDNINMNLLRSSDPAERETILLSLGTAFVATSNLSIIKKVLPFINDGDDDVKRAAVIAITFIGCEDANIISSCLVPLAQNHNSYVRATVALVLGLFSSGTGDAGIANLLEAMLYDSNDLVRQNACLGMGFVLSQMNPSLIPNYKRILDKINHIIVSKSEPSCVKIGAGIGRAISEAGGRSAIFSLANFSKIIETKRVVGALMFIQSWYWYPLMGCISLCLLPTPIFFFDENLDETDHVLSNDSKYYDYLVKLPEIRRSRKFKASKEDLKDMLIETPEGLHSGMRLTDLEKNIYGIDCGVIFRERE